MANVSTIRHTTVPGFTDSLRDPMESVLIELFLRSTLVKFGRPTNVPDSIFDILLSDKSITARESWEYQQMSQLQLNTEQFVSQCDTINSRI